MTDRCLDFDELRAAGRRSRFKRFLAGAPEPGKRRKRPRTEAEIEQLRQAHRDSLGRHPPRMPDPRTLIHPYFSIDAPELKDFARIWREIRASLEGERIDLEGSTGTHET